MHDAGCLGLVHWDGPEGWYGEGGGRRVQDIGHTGNLLYIIIEIYSITYLCKVQMIFVKLTKNSGMTERFTAYIFF